ncbi:hypothetical protein KVC03_04495 [Helicobacter pylori]|nr:hypothetical protein KVC03_04495 [Helicobacter pylori]
MEGKKEEEVKKIMEEYIDRALENDCVLKEIKSFESVMVLIFEETLDVFPQVIL